ncbi:PREDICTED: sarcolemmal membrane-associated protein-like, partial [Tauraco erythrolophus]|uniref:sarcolemmal membrane-associated protein-like n=1 Tax=Tauraco erythrolophus TaxID=121530 RepID=UPI0005239063
NLVKNVAHYFVCAFAFPLRSAVTHGCIVSTIKLFLPDGMEARLRSDVIHAPLPSPVDKVAANTPSMYSQELFQLSQYLQEALHREQMLEQKLATLQRLLAVTQEASDTSWQALIDEDRLLSRLEVMGNQLQACSKNQTEDSIRKELIALQEDKHNYETTAKESLRRVLQEKIEVVRKLSEVERSLSNTEDECTHLKEMNERTQEELRELANKYNGAVNEIKDLSDKLKVAEGRQEEIQQKGLAEKKELQHKIDEMEEREQELQAKIEALQADNDFTNERLTALQVRLEHLQEKTLKEHNSLGIQVDDFIPKINGSTEKDKIIDEGHLTKVEETKLLKENQARVKESDLSDTLSPSKEKSSDDTTDAQMDEQDLNEPIAKVALLKGKQIYFFSITVRNASVSLHLLWSRGRGGSQALPGSKPIGSSKLALNSNLQHAPLELAGVAQPQGWGGTWRVCCLPGLALLSGARLQE